MLGYDRHWSRYWLLEGSCPEGMTADDSPASCWVYVEKCHCPPGENRQHRESPHDEEEDLPLGQLAQQAQHDDEAHQRAKRRKVQIPDDQGGAVSWGCYKSVEHVSTLINYLNSRGRASYTSHAFHHCVHCFLLCATILPSCRVLYCLLNDHSVAVDCLHQGHYYCDKFCTVRATTGCVAWFLERHRRDVQGTQQQLLTTDAACCRVCMESGPSQIPQFRPSCPTCCVAVAAFRCTLFAADE